MMNLTVQNISDQVFNTKRTIVEDVKRANKIANYKRLFDEKDYFESNRPIYFVAIACGLICQLTTAISSYNYYFNKFETFIVLNDLKVLVVLCVILGIEISKFLLCKKSFPTLFLKKPLYSWIIISFLVIIWTVYTSIIGGGEIGINKEKPILATNNYEVSKDKILNVYDLEINRVTKEYDKTIDELKKAAEQSNKSFWVKSSAQTVAKTNSRLADIATKKELSLSKLREKRDQELNKLETKNNQELVKIEEENKSSANTFRFYFGVFDLLFLICTFYKYKYQHESQLQEDIYYLANLNNNKVVEKQEEESKIVAHDFTNSDKYKTENRIGFQQSFNNNKPKIEKPKIETINVEPMEKKEKIVYVDRIVEKIVYVPQPVEKTIEVPIKGKKCIHCSTMFESSPSSKDLYCSDKCKNTFWNNVNRIKIKLENNKPLNEKDLLFKDKLEKEQPARYNEILKSLIK